MTMKFGVLLFLLGVAQDVSSKAFVPGGGGGYCAISKAYQCYNQFKDVGCFNDKRHQRALPNLILTARDTSSKAYFGKSIVWEDWATFIDKFICACAKKAAQLHYDYIGIEYYGECWAGNEGYDLHHPSKECKMITYDCTFEHCNEKFKGPRKCVGGPLTLYVYKVNKKPAPPPPPPPQEVP